MKKGKEDGVKGQVNVTVTYEGGHLTPEQEKHLTKKVESVLVLYLPELLKAGDIVAARNPWVKPPK